MMVCMAYFGYGSFGSVVTYQNQETFCQSGGTRMKEIQASEVIRTSQEAGEIHAVGENIPIPNRESRFK